MVAQREGTPIDLAATYGRTWAVLTDRSHRQYIPCSRGRIYAYGGPRQLVAVYDREPLPLRREMKTLAKKVVDDPSDPTKLNAIFSVSEFRDVARVLRAERAPAPD